MVSNEAGLPQADLASQQRVAPPGSRSAPRRSASTSPAGLLALFLLLLLLALPARLIGLREATTEDEDQWIGRAGGFAAALTSGSWRNTYQIGHPGVTTMWLATLGIGLERAAEFAEKSRDERLVTREPDFLPAMYQARPLFALASALLAALCGVLAIGLFGLWPGLLGGLLLAFDPFWSGMSPIVGMDSLLTGLLGASMLSALLAFRGGAGAAWVVLGSGLLAGLALLTKAPALFLLPMAPAIAAHTLWASRRRPRAEAHGEAESPARLRWWWPTLFRLALWFGGVALAFALWPAMWSDPTATLARALRFIRETGAQPHGPGNFFLGNFIAGDPGPFFYPAVLGLRIGPAALIGLVLVVFLPMPRRWRYTAALLYAFVMLYLAGLTIAAKKENRYVLPLWPALSILAGLGWWLLWRRLERRIGAPARRLPLRLLAMLAICALQVWPLAQSAPHPLASYNPLLGGIRAAERVIPLGWGEGLDDVGAYLARQPNADRLKVGIWYPLYVNFQAHLPGTVVTLAFGGEYELSSASAQRYASLDYYVDYIHARQRRFTPRALLARRPEYVAYVNGAEYARVYRLR